MKTRAVTLIAALLLVEGGGMACTVPVFRYALDRWPADAYRLEVPEGWIKSEEAAGVRKLLEESRTELEVVTLREAGAPSRLVIPNEEETVVWSGTPDEMPGSLLLSPVREAVADHLLAGESMVWVVVPSGDAGKDQSFEERLTARLKYLKSVAAIPEQDPNDPDSQLGPGPELKVGFSLLKAGRDDPAERVFLKMLAGSESGLLESGEPFAAVVFGRGRVLGVWPASDLEDEGIDEVSLFLLRACSCRVKLLNPGWDLAMAIDWDARLLAAQMAADEDLNAAVEPRIAEVASPVLPAPETVEIGAESEVSAEKPGGFKSSTAAKVAVIGLGILAGLIALGCAISRKGD